MIREDDDSEREEQLELLSSKVGAKIRGLIQRKVRPIERGQVFSEFTMKDDVGSVKVIIKKSAKANSKHYWLVVRNTRSKGEDV